MRSWWENEAILDRFRTWLLETQEEIEALEDDEREDSDLDDAEQDVNQFEAHAELPEEDSDNFFDRNDEDDVVSDDDGDFEDEPFSGVLAIGSADSDIASLQEDPTAPERSGVSFQQPAPVVAISQAEEPAEKFTAELPQVGLLDVVEALTAMRHESKLQTKSSRGLEESVQSSIAALELAIEQFRSAQAREDEAAHRAVKPLVETLVSLDEALLRGAGAMNATVRQMKSDAPQRLHDGLESHFAGLSWWRRWLLARLISNIQQTCVEQFEAAADDTLAALTEGFQLIQTRLEKMLTDHDLTRIACVGETVDPSRMTVVELVDKPDMPPETVIDEVRPGYQWRGQVIRFAEVRATVGRIANPSIRNRTD